MAAPTYNASISEIMSSHRNTSAVLNRERGSVLAAPNRVDDVLAQPSHDIGASGLPLATRTRNRPSSPEFEVAEANGLSLSALAQELSCKPARVRMLLGQSDSRPQLGLV